MAGIGFIPVVLGVFAVSEVFMQAEKRIMGSVAAPKVSMEFPSFAEFWRLTIAVVRSMVLGFFAGEFLDRRNLVFGHEVATRLVDPDLVGDRFGAFLVVARDRKRVV